MGQTLLVVLVLLQAPAPTAQTPAPTAQAPAPTPAPPAQAPAPPAGQATAPAPATPAPPPAVTPPDPYAYSPEGRRDPFLSLLGVGADRGGAQARRGDGVSGMTVAEISVRGILQSRGMLIAMVQGPDNKTYMLRQGDRLADGAVQAVTAEGLVITQEVNDPLSLVKQRVVRKPLRALEDVKQ
jgi:Tfp pilus assembly protein PilP